MSIIMVQQRPKNIEDKIANNKVISNLKKTILRKILIQNVWKCFMMHILKKKDKNVNLIGFENGIYDLDLLKFRNGLPKIMLVIQLVLIILNMMKMMSNIMM